MKLIKWLSVIVWVLILFYFIGPHPSTPVYLEQLPVIPAGPQQLEKYIADHERIHKLKADNEARIIWYNDSVKTKTEYAVVYLHGFSASQEEGDPVHKNFAKTYGCNLFLSRLAEHGIDTVDEMINLTADKLWESAKEAYVIGKQIGKKVILMGTSTGGTLALRLAAKYPDIAALILLSPNIAINDPNAWVLNNPWGLQVARMIKGKFNTAQDTTAMFKRYWYSRYRMEAAVELEELLETSMKSSVFEKVKQPVLLLYYYKDEEHQDDVVKVSAMQRMFRQLGTADSLKREVPTTATGDHVIGSYITSKDVNSVEKACKDFATEVMHLKPVTP
jgi:esterase/lipase